MPGSTEKQVLGRMLALVVGFEIVEVRAGAVDFVGDVVAGAVREILGEAGGANHGAGGVVGFEAADRAALGEGVFDGADGGIARVADGFEDVLLVLGGLAADDAGPGDVVEDAVGLVDAGPRYR